MRSSTRCITNISPTCRCIPSVVFLKQLGCGSGMWRNTTGGGSLRVYGCHEDDSRSTKQSVSVVLQEEKDRGLSTVRCLHPVSTDCG